MSAAPGDAARLDAWLWHARLCRSRSLAARLVRGGRLRLNRRVVGRAHVRVRVGDVLTFVLGQRVRVIRVAALAGRRGPAREARALYDDLPVPPPSPGRCRRLRLPLAGSASRVIGTASMFGRLRALVGGGDDGAAGDRPAGHDELHLAAAALMIEAARLDDDFDERERAAIAGLVRRRFGLDAAAAEELLAAAADEAAESVQLYRFARVVRDRFDAEERIGLIEMMWRVVYADGEVHDYEASLLRRVAGLIYVSDRDSGAARKRAMRESAVAAGEQG